MRIQPIVEGHGEVEAVPVLLRRLLGEAGAFGLDVGKPIRKKRWEFVQEDSLRKTVQLALLQPDCSAILILFDSDDDCPKELAGAVEGWARKEARETPCQVVMAHREYEAWFLATIESLRGKSGIRLDANPHPEPETPRGAKEALEECMEPGSSYSATADQAPLTAAFDMVTAFGRCRSFRRMASAFGALVSAAGVQLTDWPPQAWLGEGD